MLKKVKDNLKYIKIKDILSVFIFIIVLLPALVFKLINKLMNKEIWLIMERENTASDNGYHFYKYLKEVHPEVNSYYVINKKCKEYENVKQFGNIIQYGSLKHWIYYLGATYNISSQKNGNPSAPLFYVLHAYLNLFNNRVFLQHGIIKDDLKWLYYDVTKFKLFICGAKDEYEYVKEKYHYPEGTVVYTGLARFDNLFKNKVNNKQILVMPTWRSYLGRETNALEKKEEFENTSYFKCWSKLLNDKKLISFLEKNDLELYFYPHINMRRFIDKFNVKTKNIKIIKEEIDIQTLLKESALMITDYSSVYMDFAYMKKPIIYYQFDQEEYRSKQYEEGYFSYEKNGFGDVITNCSDTVDKIIYYVDNNYKIENKYLKRMDKFFELNDTHNCERIYKAIVGDIK